MIFSSYCPYTDKKQEIPCDPGYYSTGNASSCEMCPPGYACPIQDQDVRYYWKLYSWTSLLILCVASLFSLSCWSCVCFLQRILSINHVVIDNVCLDRTIRKSVVSCFWLCLLQEPMSKWNIFFRGSDHMYTLSPRK